MLQVARVAAFALVAAFCACGVASHARRAPNDMAHDVRSSDQLITADEIAAWGASSGALLRDGYDLVAALRPRFLRGDGRNAVVQLQGLTPIVYVDRVRLGDVTVLRHIQPHEIAYIRFYTAVEARTAWGDGHFAGAIHVVRRRVVDGRAR